MSRAAERLVPAASSRRPAAEEGNARTQSWRNAGVSPVRPEVNGMPDDGRVTGDRRPHPSGASAQPPSSFRIGLTRGEDAVDVATWAGSVPAVTGVAPRIRLGRKWFNLLWLLPIGLVVLLRLVAAAKGLRNMPSVQGKEAL